MQYAEDIRKTILEVAEEHGSEGTFMPADVARKLDQKNWKGLVHQVIFVADVMIKEGQILLSKPKGALRYKKI